MFKDFWLSLFPFITAFLQQGISSTFSPLLTTIWSALPPGNWRSRPWWVVCQHVAAVDYSRGEKKVTVMRSLLKLMSPPPRAQIGAQLAHETATCCVWWGGTGPRKVRWLHQCGANKVLFPTAEDDCVSKISEDGPVELWSWCQNNGPSHIITKISQLEWEDEWR